MLLPSVTKSEGIIITMVLLFSAPTSDTIWKRRSSSAAGLPDIWAAAVESLIEASSSPSAKPSATDSIAGGTTYSVQSGDTLSSIARKSNTTIQAIADASKINPNTPLKVGDKLTIPKS